MPVTAKVSLKRNDPYILIGKLNAFLLIKDEKYGSGLIVEWKDKVFTLPTNLFEKDLSGSYS